MSTLTILCLEKGDKFLCQSWLLLCLRSLLSLLPHPTLPPFTLLILVLSKYPTFRSSDSSNGSMWWFFCRSSLLMQWLSPSCLFFRKSRRAGHTVALLTDLSILETQFKYIPLHTYNGLVQKNLQYIELTMYPYLFPKEDCIIQNCQFFGQFRTLPLNL